MNNFPPGFDAEVGFGLMMQAVAIPAARELVPDRLKRWVEIAAESIDRPPPVTDAARTVLVIVLDDSRAILTPVPDADPVAELVTCINGMRGAIIPSVYAAHLLVTIVTSSGTVISRLAPAASWPVLDDRNFVPSNDTPPDPTTMVMGGVVIVETVMRAMRAAGCYDSHGVLCVVACDDTEEPLPDRKLAAAYLKMLDRDDGRVASYLGVDVSTVGEGWDTCAIDMGFEFWNSVITPADDAAQALALIGMRPDPESPNTLIPIGPEVIPTDE